MTSASKLNNDYQYMTFVMRFTLSGIEYFEINPGIKNMDGKRCAGHSRQLKNSEQGLQGDSLKTIIF